jgi:hypothetical protein
MRKNVERTAKKAGVKQGRNMTALLNAIFGTVDTAARTLSRGLVDSESTLEFDRALLKLEVLFKYPVFWIKFRKQYRKKFITKLIVPYFSRAVNKSFGFSART